MSDERKHRKHPYVKKKRKASNKATKLFPNKWKRKLATLHKK